MRQPKSKKVFVHAAAVAILLVMAAPFLFTAGILVKQQLVKQQMLEKLESELVKTFTFSNRQIQWVESGKELLVNGKMFDVKHFETGVDSTIVAGIFDCEEDELVKKITLISGNSKHSPGYISALLLHSFLPVFCNHSSVCHLPGCIALATLKFRTFYQENTVTKNYPVNIPPPKYLV